MTPEELIKQRKQRELLAKASQAKTTGPSDDEKIVSDATKENLKTAGRLAAGFSKAVAEKTKQAAVLAAEKGREAQETMARRAEEAKAHKEAEAAEQAQQEAARARVLADQAAAVQPEPQVEEGVAVQSEPALAALKSVDSTVTPEPIPQPETIAAPAALELFSDAAPVVSQAVVATKPQKESGELAARVTTQNKPSTPAPASVPAPRPTSTKVHAKPQAIKSTAAEPTPAESEKESTKKGWQLLAGAGVAVMVLGGALAWWATHRSSDTEAASTTQAAAVVPASIKSPVVPATAPAQASKVEATQPAAAEPPAVAKDRPAPTPAVVVPKALAPATVVLAPTPETKPQGVSKPKPLAASKPTVSRKPAAKAQPKPKETEKAGWQEQADSDMDAWAKKSGIR